MRKRWLWLVIAGVPLALLLLVALLPWSVFIPLVEARAAAALGRPIHIGGLHVDPGRITQAWLQLAANAVKYSTPGSVITLGSRLHRGEAQLWVRDQGIGIAPEQLAVVRERFGRTSEAQSHASGAGLGLSIVESIVAAHGGRLDIESEPGAGSTFTINLPLGPERAGEEADVT